MPQAPARGNGGIVNPNAPIIFSPSMGLGAPTFTTRSPGTRLVLRDTLGASSADYAIGVETDYLWLGVDTSSGSKGVKIYGGTSAIATFTGGASPTLVMNGGTSGSEIYLTRSSGGQARFGQSAGACYLVSDTPGNSMSFYTNAGAGIGHRMVIDSTGKVGIGTSSPGGALHIAVDSSVVDAFYFQDTRASHTRTWIIGPGVGANDVFAIRDNTAGANRFNIDFSGNVGIGTATPGANLNVHGASGSLTRVLVDNDATYGVAFGVDASNVGFYGSTNATPVSIKTNNSDRVYVNTSGLVGVGSTAPLCKLHVIVGTSYSGGAPSTAGFALTDTSVDGTARALKFGINAAGGYAVIQSTLEGTDHVGLVLNGALSVTTANVMIGATSGLAGSALDVNGLVRFRGGEVLSGVTRRTSGASYTMVTSDRLVVFASGSSGTFNLIASPDTGRVVTARNDSGGNITLTPASGNINGAGTATLATGGGTDIYYDGTQWITI